MDEETQQHILLNCKILSEENEGEIEYEDIFDGSVREKVKIAKQFIKSLKSREKMKELFGKKKRGNQMSYTM